MVKIKYSIDGNKICAVYEDFVNLQESHAGFGDSFTEARLELEIAVLREALLGDTTNE